MPKPASTRSAYKMLTCIYLCRTLLFFAPYADFSSKKLAKYPFKLLGVGNNLNYFLRNNINEDGIFSLRAQHSWIFCQLPPFDVALKFAFEVNPSYLYDINNEKLPFGCHAFEKYEYNTFWQKHIKIPL